MEREESISTKPPILLFQTGQCSRGDAGRGLPLTWQCKTKGLTDKREVKLMIMGDVRKEEDRKGFGSSGESFTKYS
ncbi:hypothetical protein AOLI_G00160370 [Acnodon oligacanthus]